MKYEIRRLSLGPAAIALLALIPVVGCSEDDGLGTRYSVTGTVTYNGKPVPKAKINFVPASKDGGKQGASGDVVDGQFTLTTLSPNDGALPGEYKVSISAREMDEAKLNAEIEKNAAKYKRTNANHAIYPQEIQAKLSKESKPLIPPKFENALGSGLTAKVEERANTFTFNLTD